MRRFVSSLILLGLWAPPLLVRADVYLHHPRGSNNKLSEAGNGVNNDNRLFDSENNGQGGYQVGDLCDPGCATENEWNSGNGNQGSYDEKIQGAQQGIMHVYQGSELLIEWTQQHACGSDMEGERHHHTLCTVILQYMCDDDNTQIGSILNNGGRTQDPSRGLLRDGKSRENNNHGGGRGTTGNQDNLDKDTLPPATSASEKYPQDPTALVAPQYQSPKIREAERAKYLQRFTYKYAQHEPLDYMYDCYKRSRNKGLYSAEENLNRDNRGAQVTVQNNAGTRHGTECNEERDYYPYWHPTPWHDIAVFTSEPHYRCRYFQENSQNVKPTNYCTGTTLDAAGDSCIGHNNKMDCQGAGVGCEWRERKPWSETGYSKDEEGEPACYGNYKTSDNHLSGAGNSPFGHGSANTFYWTIPEWIPDYSVCVLRIRYNITTVDFIDLQPGNKRYDRDPVDDSDGRKIFDNQSTRTFAKDTSSLEDMFDQNDWMLDIDHRFNGRQKSVLGDDPELDTLGLGQLRNGNCVEVTIPASGNDKRKTYNAGNLPGWQNGYMCSDNNFVRFKTNEAGNQMEAKTTLNAGWVQFKTTCCEVLLRRHDLTINTNDDQTVARTFEDRTHILQVHKRPTALENLSRVSIGRSWKRRIVNINVKGRRGTGAQVYPAIQYSFTPQPLIVEVGDYLHFQWVGSDACTNGNQGNGKQGTDRSNICAVDSTNIYGSEWYQLGSSTWYSFSAGSGGGLMNCQPKEQHKFLCDYQDAKEDSTEKQKCLHKISSLAWLGQTKCQDSPTINNNQNKGRNCAQLNGASAYFNYGWGGNSLDDADEYFFGEPIEMVTAGEHYFKSTRNDDFSNRHHKGKIIVYGFHGFYWIAGIIILVAMFLPIPLCCGFHFYVKTHPGSTWSKKAYRYDCCMRIVMGGDKEYQEWRQKRKKRKHEVHELWRNLHGQQDAITGEKKVIARSNSSAIQEEGSHNAACQEKEKGFAQKLQERMGKYFDGKHKAGNFHNDEDKDDGKHKAGNFHHDEDKYDGDHIDAAFAGARSVLFDRSSRRYKYNDENDVDYREHHDCEDVDGPVGAPMRAVEGEHRAEGDKVAPTGKSFNSQSSYASNSFGSNEHISADSKRQMMSRGKSFVNAWGKLVNDPTETDPETGSSVVPVKTSPAKKNSGSTVRDQEYAAREMIKKAHARDDGGPTLVCPCCERNCAKFAQRLPTNRTARYTAWCLDHCIYCSFCGFCDLKACTNCSNKDARSGEVVSTMAIFGFSFGLLLSWLIGFLAHLGQGFNGSYWFCLAKAGGFMLNYALALVILPMMRHLSGAMRQAPRLKVFVPDENIYWHKLIAFFGIGYGTIVHTLGHIMHTIQLQLANEYWWDDWVYIYPKSIWHRYAGQPLWYFFGRYGVFGAAPISGIILLIYFTGVFLTGDDRFRRRHWMIPSCFWCACCNCCKCEWVPEGVLCKRHKLWDPQTGTEEFENFPRSGPCTRVNVDGYKVFWIFHDKKLLLFAYFLTVLHSPQRFFIWILLPMFLWAMNEAIGRRMEHKDSILLRAEVSPGDVLTLYFKLPSGFLYSAGQYAEIFWREERHPFTICSAPEEGLVAFSIKSSDSLDWCSALRKRLIDYPLMLENNYQPVDYKRSDAQGKGNGFATVHYIPNVTAAGVIYNVPVRTDGSGELIRDEKARKELGEIFTFRMEQNERKRYEAQKKKYDAEVAAIKKKEETERLAAEKKAAAEKKKQKDAAMKESNAKEGGGEDEATKGASKDRNTASSPDAEHPTKRSKDSSDGKEGSHNHDIPDGLCGAVSDSAQTPERSGILSRSDLLSRSSQCGSDPMYSDIELVEMIGDASSPESSGLVQQSPSKSDIDDESESEYDGATHDYDGGKNSAGTKTSAGRKRKDRARKLLDDLRGIRHSGYSGVSSNEDLTSVHSTVTLNSDHQSMKSNVSVRAQHDSWRNRWMQPIEVWSNRLNELSAMQDMALEKQRMSLPDNERPGFISITIPTINVGNIASGMSAQMSLLMEGKHYALDGPRKVGSSSRNRDSRDHSKERSDCSREGRDRSKEGRDRSKDSDHSKSRSDRFKESSPYSPESRSREGHHKAALPGAIQSSSTLGGDKSSASVMDKDRAKSVERLDNVREVKDSTEIEKKLPESPKNRFDDANFRKYKRAEHIARTMPPEATVLKLVGPYGAPAMSMWHFDSIILVGSGIGATPFAAMLRSANIKMKQRRVLEASMGGANKSLLDGIPMGAGSITKVVEEATKVPQMIEFHWIARNRSDFDWLFPWVVESLNGPAKECTRVTMWITAAQTGRKSVKKAGDGNGQTTTAVEDDQIFRDCPCELNEMHGRPDWKAVFAKAGKEYKGCKVGVFLCGNPMIGKALKVQCAQYTNLDENTQFHYFEENF